jgi:hypothetical protein
VKSFLTLEPQPVQWSRLANQLRKSGARPQLGQRSSAARPNSRRSRPIVLPAVETIDQGREALPLAAAGVAALGQTSATTGPI